MGSWYAAALFSCHRDAVVLIDEFRHTLLRDQVLKTYTLKWYGECGQCGIFRELGEGRLTRHIACAKRSSCGITMHEVNACDWAMFQTTIESIGHLQ